MNDSEPEAESQETVNKGKAMLKAVALAETLFQCAGAATEIVRTQ